MPLIAPSRGTPATFACKRGPFLIHVTSPRVTVEGLLRTKHGKHFFSKNSRAPRTLVRILLKLVTSLLSAECCVVNGAVLMAWQIVWLSQVERARRTRSRPWRIAARVKCDSGQDKVPSMGKRKSEMWRQTFGDGYPLFLTGWLTCKDKRVYVLGHHLRGVRSSRFSYHGDEGLKEKINHR